MKIEPLRAERIPRSQRNIQRRLIVILRVALLFAIIYLWAGNLEILTAQQINPTVESETNTRVKKLQSQSWEPPSPSTPEFDWIELSSGEWLNGELKVLYNNSLEFESEDLGLLTLDWENVQYVLGHRIFSVRLEGSIVVEGLLEVSEGKVYITVGEDRQEFERNQLVSIVPGGVREINYWTAEIGFGFNLARGNTKQTQLSGNANIRRRAATTRLVIDYLGNFTETDDETTINNHRGNTFFDYFLTKKTYLRPIFGEYFRDPFSNIRSRVTVGTGIGYQIIDTSKISWELSGGPAYQHTWFESTEADQNSSESTPGLMAGTSFNIEITEILEFDFQYNFQILNKASGSYTHHLVPALETDITDWLDFSVSFVWDRIQNPQPDAEGNVPKQDDIYFIVGLGLNF